MDYCENMDINLRYQVKRVVLKIFFIIFLLACYSQVYAQATEYKLKAAFLERFTRFVEWPENTAFSDNTKPFIITVIGESPFSNALDDLYTSHKIKNKKVRINYITDITDIDSCHILFISSSLESSLEKILAYTKTKPILTISDHDGFASRGVIINFFIADNKVRFEINEKALKQSKLYMSYLLLNVATIVKTEEGNK